MDLEDQISRINNPQMFTKLCNTILSARHGKDYQVIDGSRADEGVDGYIVSEKRIIAIYCPVKPENRRDKDYLRKIKSDLEKAGRLREAGELPVEKWTFITPQKLGIKVIKEMMRVAAGLGLSADHLDATFLANELYRDENLQKKFPDLYLPKIGEKLDELKALIGKLVPQDAVSSVDPREPAYFEAASPENDDIKRIYQIRIKEQTDTSKSDLRTIFYATHSKAAKLDAILGLLQWYDATEDKTEDMIDWCDQGIVIADPVGDKVVKAYLLAEKARFLSFLYTSEDMMAAFTIRAANTLGYPLITEEQRQASLSRLRQLEGKFEEAFTQSIALAKDIKNPPLWASILICIGNAAGGRAQHFTQFGIHERASKEKGLCRRALGEAKNIYAQIKDELGEAYALHNLANQIRFLGEDKEALSLTNQVIAIAQKHSDPRLLQCARWLKETLETGKIPNYERGERYGRKL